MIKIEAKEAMLRWMLRSHLSTNVTPAPMTLNDCREWLNELASADMMDEDDEAIRIWTNDLLDMAGEYESE